MSVHDTDHPTMKPFGSDSVQWTDEIYQYSHWQPEKVRVLMSLDMAKTDTKRPYHVPVAWVKDYGGGRMYYNNLGHRTETWTAKPFLDSMLAGILWVSGRTQDGSAAPKSRDFATGRGKCESRRRRKCHQRQEVIQKSLGSRSRLRRLRPVDHGGNASHGMRETRPACRCPAVDACPAPWHNSPVFPCPRVSFSGRCFLWASLALRLDCNFSRMTRSPGRRWRTGSFFSLWGS